MDEFGQLHTAVVVNRWLNRINRSGKNKLVEAYNSPAYTDNRNEARHILDAIGKQGALEFIADWGHLHPDTAMCILLFM